MAAESTNFMFANTLTPSTALTKFTLMRGVTDYSDLRQFDLYETGYSFLVLLDIPAFMTNMTTVDDQYKDLITSYKHILEYDFRGVEGINSIDADTNAITNGINEINVITKVNEQGGSAFSMSYFERSGSILTKVHETYLRGIKDPRTQMKRYNGLLGRRFNNTSDTSNYARASLQNHQMNEKGYHLEVFHFLLIITDNTGLNLEKAYLLTSCQPTKAPTDIYNVKKGEIGFQELSLEFQGFPITGRIVNAKAAKFLDWINKHTCFDEMSFGYNIFTKDSLSDENIEVREGVKSPIFANNTIQDNNSEVDADTIGGFSGTTV